ncbi:protein ORF106 [Lake sturgeon herpesvirus]|nr:protein ORF106 [Lake sturgeon herpesvirus]
MSDLDEILLLLFQAQNDYEDFINQQDENNETNEQEEVEMVMTINITMTASAAQQIEQLVEETDNQG